VEVRQKSAQVVDDKGVLGGSNTKGKGGKLKAGRKEKKGAENLGSR